jgi:hypothetical protein
MVNDSTATGNQRQYKPSTIDRVCDWLDDLPPRTWLVYVGIAILLIVVQILFLWLEGGLQERDLLPVIIFNSLAVPLLLAMMQFFDHQAVTALNILRPVLDTTGPDFDRYAYKLSNMPLYRPLAAGTLALVLVILMEQVWVVPVIYEALERLPVFSVVYFIIDKSSAFLYGVFFYHTVRQLRLVNDINTNHTRVNLFDLGPLQAFSRLTASTAVGLVIGVYGWMLINPDLLSDPLSLGITVLITVLAFTVFVWPLFGVHRRMAVEKEEMIHEIDLHFERVFSKFNKGLQEDDYPAVERLNVTIASLDIQHNRISAIPTWPWKPGTAQFALTAIAIPLVLAVLQFLVKQAFGL